MIQIFITALMFVLWIPLFIIGALFETVRFIAWAASAFFWLLVVAWIERS